MLSSGMPSTESWIGMGLLGVLQLGLSYILYAKAIRQVSALEALLVPVIEPILNPFWVLIFIGERPQQWAIIGGAVVLSAITVRGVLTLKHKEHS